MSICQENKGERSFPQPDENQDSPVIVFNYLGFYKKHHVKLLGFYFVFKRLSFRCRENSAFRPRWAPSPGTPAPPSTAEQGVVRGVQALFHSVSFLTGPLSRALAP